MTTAQQDPLRARQVGGVDADLVTAVAAELFSNGLPTAPHVIAKLLARVGRHAETVCEVAGELSPSQRSGQRMLPLLLPLVPSMSRVVEALDLSADDRRVLLLAALRTDDSLDLLLSAARRTADEIATGSIARQLSVSHGRCRFADQRLATWVQHAVGSADVNEAHERLSRAHRDREQHTGAGWHRARSALERVPSAATVLLSAARELTTAGEADLAYAYAVEAAQHAQDVQLDEARLIAGAAAAAAGCFEDAAEWLTLAFSSSDGSVRSRALAGLLMAQTGLRGVVPVIDPLEHRPREPDPRRWAEWARTAGLAAVLCAERGLRSGMRTWLAELRDADARAGAAGEIRDPAVALCWLLSGEPGERGLRSRGPVSGGVIPALRAAVDGDIDQGLQMLARASSVRFGEPDPLVTGFECSPLVRAHLAITETLLYFWRGDVGTAREHLAAAAVDLPVAVPFAGLGAALAGRLDVAALGGATVLSQTLAATLPAGIRVDRLVERALAAYLGGVPEQAHSDIVLWHDRGAPESALSLPGLEEVGPIIDLPRVEPPELIATRDLIVRIRRLPESTWRRDYDEIVAAGRELNSSMCRGRVEAMLGSSSVIHDDVSAGLRHLRTARSLFEDAGAFGWRDAVEDRIARLGAQLVIRSGPATAPITVVRDPDPIEHSRVAWSAILSSREVEVAMRVVEGLTNGEIAEALGVSVRTVEVHVGRILSTLGVRNRVQLTALAHRTARHV